MDARSMRVLHKRSTDEIYIHEDDVAQMLLDFAASEDTDVRTRMQQLAENIRVAAAKTRDA